MHAVAHRGRVALLDHLKARMMMMMTMMMMMMMLMMRMTEGA